MGSVIVPIMIGIILIILGVTNMGGNITSVHWYHRQRVREEDRVSYGKLVGRGTLVIGISVVLFGCFALLAETLKANLYLTIGSVVAVVGIIVGLALGFFAMIKYNKGIF